MVSEGYSYLTRCSNMSSKVYGVPLAIVLILLFRSEFPVESRFIPFVIVARICVCIFSGVLILRER
jgi:hypothetical protein